MISLLLNFAFTAAALSNPEPLHQAPAGVLEATPALSWNQSQSELKNGAKSKNQGFREAVKVERGLNEMFSTYGSLAHHAYTATTTNADSTRDAGIEDVEVGLLGRYEMNEGSFRYGLSASFEPSAPKIESNGDSNAVSGGVPLAPFIGFERASGPYTVGARIKYKFWVTDRKGTVIANSGQTLNFTTRGGNVLSPQLFFERPLGATTFGFTIGATYVDGATTQVDGLADRRAAPSSLWQFNFYLPYDVTPGIRLIPVVGYGQLTSFNTATTNSGDVWGAEISARFML